MERRSFLQGTTTLVLSQLLISCTQSNQQTFEVQLLKDSIPGQVVDQFRRSLEQKPQLKFIPVEQLRNLFQQLQNWQKKTNPTPDSFWRRIIPFIKAEKPNPADLVTLGDYWLSYAIKDKLIQPLSVNQLKNWSNLPKQWQELVTRNDQGFVDAQGKVWAAPYRWGSTVIVYNRHKFEKLGWMPKDWSDLWRSELRGRISLLDQPREVIGIVLKKLGQSYNTVDFKKVPSLEAELRVLNQQVKFYSSNRYLEPLIIGDTWLAVGWSNDILPVLGRYPELVAVIPQSGTALWADLWVSPTGKDRGNFLYQWIDFCLSPHIAKQIYLLTKTNSPISTEINVSDFPEQLRNILISNPEVFAKSEFLLPLPAETTEQYKSLFEKIR
ncbi:extracellular solute-binding protein [Iningainema tapete]|uniref:Extracellular solute-binding protein n=1 Tax=Iningainema tapete BLCC-T55 TaxID=2748662 RepID=A0A8J6XRA4_9CYAN|nr:extracellular solute-binding protein [Iningainema tapete]MBD2776001.1 extracellular solute-binding protein [Iningainema tapete BLCC-T55]